MFEVEEEYEIADMQYFQNGDRELRLFLGNGDKYSLSDMRAVGVAEKLDGCYAVYFEKNRGGGHE